MPWQLAAATIVMTQKGTPAAAPHICATTQCCSCFSIQTCAFADIQGTMGFVHQAAMSLCLNIVTVLFATAVICLYSNLYTYKASVCKHTNITLHCATSMSSLWYMGYVHVPCSGALEHPRIYRTNMYIGCAELICCFYKLECDPGGRENVCSSPNPRP